MRLKITFLVSALIFSSLSFAQIRYGGNTSPKSDGNISMSYSNPQVYEIAEINVEGSEFLDSNALISISGLKIGDKIKIPGDHISSAIKKLWKQGLIGDIKVFASKVENGKVFLTISLTERPRLSKFNFTGITKSQESEIREKINLIRGRVMTDAVIKNAELTVKKYFAEKGYLNTEVDINYVKDTIMNNNVVLEVDVDKKSKVKVHDINFYGDENFSSSKLKKKLKNTGERVRFKLPSALISKTIQFVKSGEQKKPLMDTSALITKQGAKSFLNNNVKLNFFKSSKFVKAKYEEDKEKLISFYNSKGYRDAEIVLDTLYRYDEKSVDIDFHVSPGTKYYFRNIMWKGNYVYEDEYLDKILAIEKGDVYDLELLDKKLQFNPNGLDVSSQYLDHGYLFSSITPVEVKIEGDSIDVEMRVFEGAKAKINKVYVTGNDRTNDHVIMREIRTLPGQYFSRAELIRTQRELSQLGYFDPEQVSPTPLPNPADETVDIEWSVVERPSDQIELSGGWGGTFGFVGTLGLIFNNFSLRNIPNFDKWRPLPVGDGQKLSLRFQANGRQFQSYSTSFSEPWLGGKKPNSFGVSFNYSVQRSINYITDETLGSLKVLGATVSLGRRVKWPDDYFTISNSVSYLNYDLYNFGQSLGFSSGVANNFTFNTTIARNSIDNPMFPRGGSSVSLNIALTPPFSLFRNINYETAENVDKYKWVEYHKWMFDAKYYLKLIGNLVLESRGHIGVIGQYTSKAGIGPFERFQLGGDGLTGTNFLLGNEVIGLRGYPNNSIVPNDDSGTPTDSSDDIRGGTIFNKYVMELRYPVSLNPSATIYVLAFAEAGNNWNKFSDFNPNVLKKSMGFGARIFMPAFGLLGLDWGYGFDNDPTTGQRSGAQFHFSIGQLLR
ncbi:POTRA domain-containing protein [Reichenbachiella sp. MALMAid0571]|uniref:BamA/OMP85 family outer membrane protein n=1 Tax=Reichenbachiella sp. MALMAid0571 TaxID=3143939 RepID=UPI0032DE98EC